MPANSALRRAAKTVLAPVLGERGYRQVQALSMARDIRSGVLTEPEVELIPKLVKPGDTVVDVGANYGMYVYPLSRSVGAEGRVWAFEPVPFTVATLRTVVRLLRLGNVEVVAKGCSDRAGRISFEVPVQDSGAISAGQAHAASRKDDRAGHDDHVRWANSETIECEVVRIDDQLADLGPTSLIKLDIEGAELAALRGAEALLDRDHPAVICEINPWFLEGFGIALRELLDFFDARGYSVHRLVDGRLHPVAEHEIEEDNYVFLPAERRALVAELIDA